MDPIANIAIINKCLLDILNDNTSGPQLAYCYRMIYIICNTNNIIYIDSLKEMIKNILNNNEDKITNVKLNNIKAVTSYLTKYYNYQIHL